MNLVQDAVYGPVPSWRFGRSLGIDPTLPPKKCSLGCVYCQVGATREYLNYEDAKQAELLTPNNLRQTLRGYIKDLDLSEVDIIIFSGSGEPSLNDKIEEMIDIVRTIIPNKPVGILSNCTMIGYTDVKKMYRKLDMVTLKLDTADQNLYHKLNHPSKYVPAIDRLIEHYKVFNETYGGFFGIEVMAMNYKGISNISGGYAFQLINAIDYIAPDVVQIEVPYRPTAKSMVEIPDRELIEEFANHLKSLLGANRVWLYGEHNAMTTPRDWPVGDIDKRIITLLNHRPCSLQDLINVFGKKPEELNTILNILLEDKKIRKKTHENSVFFIPF